MTASDVRAAQVALARAVGLETSGLADRLESTAPQTALAEELGAGVRLLPDDPGPRIADARRDLAEWQRAGLQLVSVRDDAYPDSLRQVHDRPPLIWVAGDATLAAQVRAVAIVGTRHPSDDGRAAATELAADLVNGGFTVVSGLAAGIDTIAHRAAIEASGWTVAVIGTGLGRAYPPENAALQAELARDHAVISSFWPDDGPSPERFRRRNAVMSGLSLGTVIVEASVRSGTRVQARRALAHGRPVFLRRALLTQTWAAELARRPGVHVVDNGMDVREILERTLAPAPLTDGPDPVQRSES